MILSERNLFIYPRLINLPNDHGAAAKPRGNYRAHLICVALFHAQPAPVTSVCVSACEGPAGRPQHAPASSDYASHAAVNWSGI